MKSKRDIITTIGGLLASVPVLAKMIGVSFGHIGSVTGPEAIGAVGTVMLGWFAADKMKAQAKGQ